MKAAQQMRDGGYGILAVGSESELVGVITDRDIVVRAVADGKAPERTTVGEWMIDHVVSCREADTLTEATRVMRINRVNRLIVREAGGRACGILSFGAILRKDEDEAELSEIVALAAGHLVA